MFGCKLFRYGLLLAVCMFSVRVAHAGGSKSTTATRLLDDPRALARFALVAPSERADLALRDHRQVRETPKLREEKIRESQRHLSAWGASRTVTPLVVPVMTDILETMGSLVEGQALHSRSTIQKNADRAQHLFRLHDLIKRLVLDYEDDISPRSPENAIAILYRLGETKHLQRDSRPFVDQLATIIREHPQESAAFCVQVERLEEATGFGLERAINVVCDVRQDDSVRVLAASFLAQCAVHGGGLFGNDSARLLYTHALASFSEKYTKADQARLAHMLREQSFAHLSDKDPLAAKAILAPYYDVPDGASETLAAATLREDKLLDQLRTLLPPCLAVATVGQTLDAPQKSSAIKPARETAATRKAREDEVDALCATLGVTDTPKKKKKPKPVSSTRTVPAPRGKPQPPDADDGAESKSKSAAAGTSVQEHDDEQQEDAACAQDWAVAGRRKAFRHDAAQGPQPKDVQVVQANGAQRLTHKQERALKNQQKQDALPKSRQAACPKQPAKPVSGDPGAFNAEETLRCMRRSGVSREDRVIDANVACIRAAKTGNVDFTRAIFNGAGDLVQRDWAERKTGNTALHGAAASGDEHVVRFVLGQGFSLEAVNSEGLTPAMIVQMLYPRNISLHALLTPQDAQSMTHQQAASQADVYAPDPSQVLIPLMVPPDFAERGVQVLYEAYAQGYGAGYAGGKQNATVPDADRGTPAHPLSFNVVSA